MTGVVACLIALALAFLPILSDATEFCPLSHKLNPDRFCRATDRAEGKVLVEHFDRDTNALELSIHEGKQTTWIDHPHGEVQNLSNHVPENVIVFDADRRGLLVNGQPFPIRTREAR